MALRVPTVAGPSVADRPLQGGFQKSSASPGMLHNPQLAEAGRAMQEMGAVLQERQDADELMRAETAVKSKYLEWEGEAKQRRGQQAWGVAKEAGEFWDKQATEISKSITSPRARMLFEREVQKHRAQSVGAFSGFEAGQRRASLDESAQASIVQSINMAAANPSNIELLQSTKADILKRNQVRAQVNGWAPEMRDAKQAEYLTNFHKQVIQALVATDPTMAQAYFEANKAEIDGSQHAEVGAFAAKATATHVGDTAAEAIWQTVGPKSDREPVNVDVLLAKAREQLKDKPEAMKEAISGLKERAAAFKDSRRERDDQLEASVNQAILDGAPASQIRRMPQFLALSSEAARKLSDFMDNRVVRAEQIAAARDSRAASRESRVDAAEAREERRRGRQGMAAYLVYSNPDTLASMSEAQVLNLLPALGGEHTKHLMQQRRALADPKKVADARMDRDDFNHVARQLALPVDERATPDQKAAMGELHFRVEQMIDATQRRTGKTMARDEKLQMMRSEMAKTVKVEGWFTDKDVPVIALTPAQKAKVQIPATDRQQIVEALRQKYRANPLPQYEPNEANVVNTFLMRRSGAAALVPDGR